MNGWTGFNADAVSSTISRIQNAYDELVNTLVSRMQSDFINPMSECWACKEAQDWFKKIKSGAESFDGYDKLIDEYVNGNFSAVVARINIEAQKWAENTGSAEAYRRQDLSTNSSKISVDCIQENIAGNRGVMEIPAVNNVGKLSAIESAVESAISNAKSAISNSGFLGGDQEEGLVQLLGFVSKQVGQLFAEIREGASAGIKSAIEKYGQISEDVKTSFTSGI